MSTTSVTTASAARDCIPSDVADLSNHMCIFILTRGNGIPFDACSIQEEDIIEIVDDELQQLMEDLCQEVTLQELNAPPDVLWHNYQYIFSPLIHD